MLRDLKPLVGKVSLRGQELEVYPLTFDVIASIVQKFPQIGTVLSGNVKDWFSVLAYGPELAGIVIAAVCGEGESDEAIKIARSLSIDEQSKVLDEVKRISFEGEALPFVERLQRWGVVALRQDSSDGKSNGSGTTEEPSKP